MRLGRVVTRKGHEEASGALIMWSFLVWVVVTWVGSLSDNS